MSFHLFRYLYLTCKVAESRRQFLLHLIWSGRRRSYIRKNITMTRFRFHFQYFYKPLELDGILWSERDQWFIIIVVCKNRIKTLWMSSVFFVWSVKNSRGEPFFLFSLKYKHIFLPWAPNLTRLPCHISTGHSFFTIIMMWITKGQRWNSFPLL